MRPHFGKEHWKNYIQKFIVIFQLDISSQISMMYQKNNIKKIKTKKSNGKSKIFQIIF